MLIFFSFSNIALVKECHDISTKVKYLYPSKNSPEIQQNLFYIVRSENADFQTILQKFWNTVFTFEKHKWTEILYFIGKNMSMPKNLLYQLA